MATIEAERKSRHYGRHPETGPSGSTRRELSLWVVTAFSIVGVVAGFNLAVDPFGYFGTNTIGYFFSSEREFKFNLVGSYDYDAVLLGDSRMAYVDPVYLDATGFTYVNAGIAGSSLAEALDLLRASRLDRLQLAVLGVRYRDLEDCSKPPSSRWSLSWNPVRYAASWLQLRYAVEALIARGSGQSPSYHPDGTREVAVKAFDDAALPGKTDRYWKQIEKSLPDDPNGPPDFRLGTGCRETLAAMSDLARHNGFDLLVVFWPANSDLLARVNWSGPIANERINVFVDKVKEVVPNVVDLSRSPFSDSRNFWLNDPVHLKPEAGARVIEDALAERAIKIEHK